MQIAAARLIRNMRWTRAVSRLSLTLDQQTKDPDVLNVLVLERVDRTKNMARHYVLSVEPTLFANRRWCAAGVGSAAPGEHKSTFMLPRRSRR